MIAGFILGLVTAVPAFVWLFWGIDERASVFAALITGIAFSMVCGLLISRIARAASAAWVVWWGVAGMLVGISEAVAGGAACSVSLGTGIIIAVGSPALGILGGVLGAFLGVQTRTT